ncbi:mannose-6-phosphate isomerase, class I [Microbacterium sp. KUDC0406]|uniref:mannose-6-phosphate isomerase, class I n=1 Tax=Microbacterium sp. KUDC0406 TaxID=2909588 RepID=UPI001F35845E|nr:mannose-6-phosphate isomerase, class I [Microbacterium sp. KUDC0406]UJP11466.1 mannose-6-phosphate isomerase, class I [Microbacterium sp. KUDC0406]
MLMSLTNAPRDYAWGSTSLLAELEGRAPAAGPEAEVWFGDHPGDPADLADGRTLDAVTGGSLSFLLKLLAAADPLSIQVHPTREQARAGYALEAALPADDPHRNYRDDNHKPELIVVLSERFEALAGLRPVDGTLRLLEALGDGAGVCALRSRLTGGGDVLRDTIGWLLSGDAQPEVDDVIAALAAAESSEFATELAVVRSIAGRYPGDPGVIVALLMNVLVLSRGEGVFLRAGLLHAYVSGLGVEIMAASDNVLRGGLTPKHIDVRELLAILDTTPGEVPVLHPGAGAVTAYEVPVPDFALRRAQVDGAGLAVQVDGPAMVLATAGEIVVRGADGEPVTVPVGTAVFVSAEERRLVLEGSGEAFIAQPGATN